MTAPRDATTAPPPTIPAAFEMVNSARLLLYTAAEALDSIVADDTSASTAIGDIANQLQDVINAGEVELRVFIQAGR